MALIVEDGTGVQGAESYADAAFITAYWAARPQNALAAGVAAASTANLEGAAREATGFIEATWGNYYRGKRSGYAQGLMWPRTDAFDEQEYPLPALPTELQTAVAELAARAIADALAKDFDAGGMVSSEQVGPIRITYEPGAPAQKVYGVIGLTLAPILNGSQPEAPNPRWAWS